MFTLRHPPSPMTRTAFRQLSILPLLGVIAAGASLPTDSYGQVAVEGDGVTDPSQIRTVLVERRRGFPAAWVGALDAWGWTLTQQGDSAVAQREDGSRVRT